MSNYYSDKLNSSKLKRCYDIAPRRVKQFLEAEINFVKNKINIEDTVLDLGCGYGRVAIEIAEKAKKVVGIDISRDNICMAEELYGKKDNLIFFEMNALNLDFPDNHFDVTICVQNGISAFKANPHELFKESLRVTKTGGRLLFSSYCDKFWDERLNWFKIQANEHLLGEIDMEKTGNGNIVCKDGFYATTYSEYHFLELASKFNVDAITCEVDSSSVFCEMIKNNRCKLHDYGK